MAAEYDAINLSQGFPNFKSDPKLVEGVSKAMHDGYNQYAPMAGNVKLREAIADKFENCENYAIDMHANTNSTLVARRCEFKECQGGLSSFKNASSHFYDCTFYLHKVFGLYTDQSIVHLHGEATVIHSNGAPGIYAASSANILIHLPSHHNTHYNNSTNQALVNEEEDREILRLSGGTITYLGT